MLCVERGSPFACAQVVAWIKRMLRAYGPLAMPCDPRFSKALFAENTRLCAVLIGLIGKHGGYLIADFRSHSR